MSSLDEYGRPEPLAWNSAFIGDEFFAWNLRQNLSVSALVLGRRTHDHFAAFWPSPEADAHAPETAAFMNAVPKLVVSRSGTVASWTNTDVTDGRDLASDLARLRDRTAGDTAVLGSSTLTASLLEQGLVDELRVLVHPVLLGAGRSLFAGLGEQVTLTTTAVTSYRSGNVLLTYRPA